MGRDATQFRKFETLNSPAESQRVFQHPLNPNLQYLYVFLKKLTAVYMLYVIKIFFATLTHKSVAGPRGYF